MLILIVRIHQRLPVADVVAKLFKILNMHLQQLKDIQICIERLRLDRKWKIEIRVPHINLLFQNLVHFIQLFVLFFYEFLYLLLLLLEFFYLAR